MWYRHTGTGIMAGFRCLPAASWHQPYPERHWRDRFRQALLHHPWNMLQLPGHQLSLPWHHGPPRNVLPPFLKPDPRHLHSHPVPYRPTYLRTGLHISPGPRFLPGLQIQNCQLYRKPLSFLRFQTCQTHRTPLSST